MLKSFLFWGNGDWAQGNHLSCARKSSGASADWAQSRQKFFLDNISHSPVWNCIPECVNFSSFCALKNFDYPEKPLKYKHIRRISDWFYYQFTTFNGLRLDMPEHLASMKQPNTNATHWRRGTSAITQFHIAPHWRRYLIPTGKQGTPLFFYPHVTQ